MLLGWGEIRALSRKAKYKQIEPQLYGLGLLVVRVIRNLELLKGKGIKVEYCFEFWLFDGAFTYLWHTKEQNSYKHRKSMSQLREDDIDSKVLDLKILEYLKIFKLLTGTWKFTTVFVKICSEKLFFYQRERYKAVEVSAPFTNLQSKAMWRCSVCCFRGYILFNVG